MDQRREIAASAPQPQRPRAQRAQGVVGAARKAPFPSREARQLIRDLTEPRPSIYWADLLFHVTLGWTAFIFALSSPLFSSGQVFSTAVSTFALYRSVIFIHELAHRKEKSLASFRLVWNLVCGFPLLTPSFTYERVHNDHHGRNVYGTKSDGEYLAFALKGRAEIAGYLLLSFVLPIVFALRFLVLTPLSHLHPVLRRWVWERVSSLAIDSSYRRRSASSKEMRTWRVQEAAALVYGVALITLVATGVLSVGVLLLWYLVAVSIFLLNSLRTLAAHRYRNPEDRVMGLEEQFLDSVDIPGNRFLTALWAPVGLRYHATHHLFPGIPYHALGEAHRRLTGDLQDNEVYLAATRKSLRDALAGLWRDAGSNAALPLSRSASA